jgi:hypothetical protein
MQWAHNNQCYINNAIVKFYSILNEFQQNYQSVLFLKSDQLKMV